MGTQPDILMLAIYDALHLNVSEMDNNNTYLKALTLSETYEDFADYRETRIKRTGQNGHANPSVRCEFYIRQKGEVYLV